MGISSVDLDEVIDGVSLGFRFRVTAAVNRDRVGVIPCVLGPVRIIPTIGDHVVVSTLTLKRPASVPVAVVSRSVGSTSKLRLRPCSGVFLEGSQRAAIPARVVILPCHSHVSATQVRECAVAR